MDIGYNGTEFKFDGVDDYIEVYTENNKIEEGITFKFYCKSQNKDGNISMIGKTKKMIHFMLINLECNMQMKKYIVVCLNWIQCRIGKVILLTNRIG